MLLENLSIGRLVRKEKFLDQEVRRAGIKMYTCSSEGRTAGTMGCDTYIVNLCHSCDFLSLQNATTTNYVGLDHAYGLFI